MTDQRSFYNIAIEIEYLKYAHDLLGEIKKIETNLGRKKTIRYGPRIIDIDIIFLNEDELAEITPKNIRLRKKILNENDRKRFGKTRNAIPVSVS